MKHLIFSENLVLIVVGVNSLVEDSSVFGGANKSDVK